MPGSSEPSVIFIIECKNYSHAVPVDDVEEFFAKVEQVAATGAKAVLASTAPFQLGTREYAKSKRIGLLRYFSPGNFKWELKRPAAMTARMAYQDETLEIVNGLSDFNYASLVFNFYTQSPAQVTNYLWDFFNDLLIGSGLTVTEIGRLLNPRSKIVCTVPYIERIELETTAEEVISTVSYAGGELKLDELCALEQAKTGLQVKTDVVFDADERAAPVLGRISFDLSTIKIYRQVAPNRGRERFTLAHELAHYFLLHGNHLRSESCEASDFTLHRRVSVDGVDIARMEFQANFFASCLLMPRQYFFRKFDATVKKFGISNRGFGALYVDNQPCNIQSLILVTTDLANYFGVSQSAVRIRLETLGLLREQNSAVHAAAALSESDFFSVAGGDS